MRKLSMTVLLNLLLWASQAGARGPEPVQKPARVIIASKVDTEGAVLGQMMVQLLRSEGIPVEDKTSFSTTSVTRKALIQGQIHLYPEYTGNGAFFFSLESSPVWKDHEQGYAKVRQLDYNSHKIVWLRPAPADNTWAIAVRKDLAEKEKLRSLADLTSYLKKGGYFKLAASEEFIESKAALPAFQKAYGFTLTSGQLLSFAGGNTANTEKAAALKQNGVNASMAYGTDGGLASFRLVILSDPKRVQPVYAPAPVVREATLKAYPRMKHLLESLYEKLDSATLQSLNEKVALRGVPASEVAKEYLMKAGLVKTR